MACHVMACHVMEPDGMEWHGMEWDGMEWDDWKALARQVDSMFIEQTSTSPFISLLLHVGTLHCHGGGTVSESGSGCICASIAL
jgi:hypothetical protein